MSRSLMFSCFFLVLIASQTKTAEAFGVNPIPSPATKAILNSSATRLYGWADAFKNDSSLGKAPNAGLTNGPNYNENVTVNGKKVPGAVAGQKLTVAAGKVRVRIPVNCQKGDCGTCMVELNGRKVKGKLDFVIADVTFPFLISFLPIRPCR